MAWRRGPFAAGGAAALAVELRPQPCWREAAALAMILVSGFEPFGGETVNPAAEVVRALAGAGVGRLGLRGIILPVDWEAAPGRLRAELDRLRPRALIMLGQAAGLTGLALERVAVNARSGLDSAGREVRDRPVVEGGPAAYFSTLPLPSLKRALREQGVPAALSGSAGVYLCNAVFYAALHHLEQGGCEIPAGFIHLPLLPEQAAVKDPPPPSVSLEDQVRGILTVAAALAGATLDGDAAGAGS